MTDTSAEITNALSVDVEDYFQVSAFERSIARAAWETLPRRVAENTHRVLDMFAAAGVKATFFTLGWVAEREPTLIQRIVEEGHELACHGYEHVRVTEQTPAEFRTDVEKSRKILEDVGGCAVIGYRAASYSIGAKNLWALDELESMGFVYSSSIYPVRHDLYGMPDAPRFRFTPTKQGKLLEVPVTTVRGFGHNVPCGGGGYFRLFPYAWSKWAIRRVNRHDRQAAVFYFHPWEIDPAQPVQQDISLKTRVRHYTNLDRMETRLKRLLQDFQWDTLSNVFLPKDVSDPRAANHVSTDPGSRLATASA